MPGTPHLSAAPRAPLLCSASTVSPLVLLPSLLLPRQLGLHSDDTVTHILGLSRPRLSTARTSDVPPTATRAAPTSTPLFWPWQPGAAEENTRGHHKLGRPSPPPQPRSHSRQAAQILPTGVLPDPAAPPHLPAPLSPTKRALSLFPVFLQAAPKSHIPRLLPVARNL